MNKGTKIGLMTALTAIGAGTVWAICSSSKEAADEIQKDEQQHGATPEDNFIATSNARIQAALTPLKERQKEKYLADLKRYGTTQGIIDVSNDELAKKSERSGDPVLDTGTKRTTQNMSIVGKNITRNSLPHVIEKVHRKAPKTYSTFYKWLLKEFCKTQITITNTSNEERVVSLWGMNKGISVSPPLVTDVEDHEITYTVNYGDAIFASAGSAAHPQGIVYNPANGLAYVANQLSNNVSVIDANGQLVQLIALQPSLIPGFNSPVAVAVNSNSASANYGKVYVAGSVSNTVSVIDLSFNVTNTIVTGVRPIDLTFNPVNEQLYVANLFSDDVTVIDTTTENVSSTLAVGTNPLGVGVNPTNGEIYVANSGDDTVSVFDASDNLVTTIVGVGTTPVSVTYHPINDEMYAVATGSNEVFPIEASTHNLLAPIATGNSPYKSAFNSSNNYLYVGNRTDETFTVIALDKSIRATINKGNVNIGFTINPAANQLLVSDTSTDLVNLIGYADQSSSISINEDYGHKSQNFMHNPAIVKHTKWVLSGDERFKVLNHIEETPTGTKKTTPISHENYKSPQNFLNVSELTELEGTTIDGKNTWQFKIAGLQTITLIVYFRQFEFWRTMSANKYDGSTGIMSQTINEK